MISLAVLEDCAGVVVVRSPTTDRRVSRPIAGFADLVDLARALEVQQLWLHPSWQAAHRDVQLCTACAGGQEQHRHWHALEVDRDRRAILAMPAGDETMLPAETLADCRDGRELLRVLLSLEGALGTHWRGTPGRTGLALVRADLRRRRLLDELLEAPPVPFPVEPDFGWRRPLSGDEARRRWLYCFDKHNQYLVAAGTVELGLGEPELTIDPAFHARVAGFWHVRTRAWPSGALLPDPTTGGPASKRSEGFRWLSTPTVEAAWSAGIVEAIAAVWIWRKHGRLLRPTAELIRRALEANRQDPLVAPALKATYAEAFGGYLAGGHLRERGDRLYRPDWRDLLKAEARSRLWYSLRPLEAAGIPPVAIATDAIYVPSDAPTAAEALHELLMLGDRPRQWAFKGRVRLDDVRDLFGPDVGYARPLAERVRGILSAHGREVAA